MGSEILIAANPDSHERVRAVAAEDKIRDAHEAGIVLRLSVALLVSLYVIMFYVTSFTTATI